MVSYPESLSDVINNEVTQGENINLEIGGAVGVRVRKWRRTGSAEKETIFWEKKVEYNAAF